MQSWLSQVAAKGKKMVFIHKRQFNAVSVLSYIGSFNEQGKNSADRRVIREAFAGRSSDIAQHAKYMEKTVNDLIKSKSYTLVGGTKRSVNIVRDVLRFLPVHFVSNQIVSRFVRFACYRKLKLLLQAGLPLKTDNEPTGFYYEQELLGMLENIHESVSNGGQID